MDSKIDCYGVLEVDRRASPEVIQAAYHALVRRWKYKPGEGADRDSFRQLNEAFEILSDPQKRAQYDEQWKNLTGKIVGQRYQVLERIGEGDYYYDYKGEHTVRKLPVLIRQCSEISPQKEKILLDEAETLWDLRHHSLSLIRDIFRLDDGSLAIVMSYIEGRSLADWVKDLGPLDPESVGWIIQRALNALLYMHERGIIHKGINPKSIIIQDHLVVLANLNRYMTKSIEDPESREFASLFAPPEEESGLPLVPESDIYSLGMSMLYALSGDIKHTQKRVVPTSVPEPLVRFIRKLIVQEVTARPSRADILFEEIQQVRVESFGRLFSGMKPIEGLKENKKMKKEEKNDGIVRL